MDYLCTCGDLETHHVWRAGRNRCTVCPCEDFDWDDEATDEQVAAEVARDVPGGYL